MRAGKERQSCRILRKYQLQLNRLNLIMQQLSHKCPEQGRECRQGRGKGGGVGLGGRRKQAAQQANKLWGGGVESGWKAGGKLGEGHAKLEQAQTNINIHTYTAQQ